MLLISLLLLLLATAISITKEEAEVTSTSAIRPITIKEIGRITSILLLYAAYITYNQIDYTLEKDIGVYNGLFQITIINQSFEIFALIMASIIILITSFDKYTSKTKSVLNTNIVKSKEYYLIILFNLLGVCFLLKSRDLITMYMAIELQSFSLYILSTIYRDSVSSVSGGLKYFLLGGLGSCFILLGSGLIYTNTGLTNLESIYILNTLTNSLSLNISFILIWVGFLFKIGAAPFHNWSPDVYDNVPTTVTLWLTIIPKLSILIFLLSITNNNLITFNITGLLLLSSFLSLIIGTIVGLVQYRIKRLLTYSTISHLGFLLLALSTTTSVGYESFFFYLITYTITNANNFLIIITFGWLLVNYNKQLINKSNDSSKASEIQYIDDLTGCFKTNPVLSLCFIVSLFSLAGIPPLVGFFAKQMVLLSALKEGYVFLSIVAILVSVISASYYLKIIKTICFLPFEGNNIFNDNNSINHNSTYISNIISFFIALFTLFIVLFFIYPTPLLNWTHLLALSLFTL